VDWVIEQLNSAIVNHPIINSSMVPGRPGVRTIRRRDAAARRFALTF
jgi:hypothetical protein